MPNSKITYDSGPWNWGKCSLVGTEHIKPSTLLPSKKQNIYEPWIQILI